MGRDGKQWESLYQHTVFSGKNENKKATLAKKAVQKDARKTAQD